MRRKGFVAVLVLLVSMVGVTVARADDAPPADSGVAPMQQIKPAGKSLGAVLVIHGGAWNGHGAGAVEKVLPAANRMVRRGYTAYLVDYRSGADGFDDVVAAYRAVRKATPRNRPVCVWGESAGGHFALMLDVRFSPDCVMTVAAPTDLSTLDVHPTDAHKWAQDVVDLIFGALPGGLEAWSPARVAGQLSNDSAMLYSRDDPLVDPDQGKILRPFLGAGHVIVGNGGPLPYVHAGGIDSAAWARFTKAERAVLHAATVRRAARR